MNTHSSTHLKTLSKSLPFGELHWLRPNYEYNLQILACKGYETINYAAAYGSGAARYWGAENFDFDLYQRLIPVPIADWDPDVAKSRAAPPHYLEQFPFLFEIVEDTMLPKAFMAPYEIRQWILDEISSLKLGGQRYERLFVDASRLIRLGYRLSRVAGRRFPVNSTPIAATLCMVGLGSVYYSHREEICPNCYRIASPSIGRCTQHSQSKHAYLENSSRSINSQAARTGRRIMAMLKLTEQTLSGRLPNLGLDEWRTAGMLWPLRKEQHFKWNRLVAEALLNAPLISERLPDNFLALSNNIQLALLRSALDENEWRIDRWPLKIRAAQQWFENEKIVAPGRKNSGFSAINEERLKQACALRELGDKPSEIAKKLGISNSHLSQLWRRQKIKSETKS